MREILRIELDRVLELRGLRQSVSGPSNGMSRRSTSCSSEASTRRTEPVRFAARSTATFSHRSPRRSSRTRRPRGISSCFLRADGERIDAVFIDPDASDGERNGEASVDSHSLSLPGLVLEATGSAAELELLEASCERLSNIVDSEHWRARRKDCVEAMAAEDFWEDDESLRDARTPRAHGSHRDGARNGGQAPAAPARRRARSRPRSLAALPNGSSLLERAIDGLQNNDPQDAFLRIEALPEPRGEGRGQRVRRGTRRDVWRLGQAARDALRRTRARRG